MNPQTEQTQQDKDYSNYEKLIKAYNYVCSYTHTKKFKHSGFRFMIKLNAFRYNGIYYYNEAEEKLMFEALNIIYKDKNKYKN